MANLGFTFNPDEVPADEGGDFPLIPAGHEATMQFIKTEVKMKDAAGQLTDNAYEAKRIRIDYRVKILDGQYEGRLIFGGMNIMNPNDQAQLIGQQELAKAFHVTGTPPSDESDDLLEKPFRGSLKIVTDKTGKYEPKNEVNWRKCTPYGVSAANAGSANTRSASTTQKPAATAAAAQGDAPWKRGKAA